MANTGFDVWISTAQWEQVLPMLEVLNAPGAKVCLPADDWPAILTAPRRAAGHFEGSDKVGAREAVGASLALDVLDRNVFDKKGWTPERFEQYVLSRSHLHVTVGGRQCPTLAVLASYLGTEMVVSEQLDERWNLWFISSRGEVLAAGFDGEEEGLETVRGTFFQGDMSVVRAIPGFVESMSGTTAPDSVVARAVLRQQQLADWHLRHTRGMQSTPKGAELSAHDLEFVHRDDIEPERPVLARARSSQHLYEVIFPLTKELAPLEVLCAVDGVLQNYADPTTGVLQGPGAHVSDWADWMLQDSVSGVHKAAGNLWEGDGAEAELYRLSNNIVEYDEHETSTSQFTCALELQAWVNKALGKSAVPIVASMLDDVSFTLKTEKPMMMQQHTFDRSESPMVKLGYFPRPFKPWDGVENWQSGGHSRYSRHPALQLSMDGGNVDTVLAVNCLDAEELRHYQAEETELVEDGCWFMLCLEGVRTCITFPARGTMLGVVTDNDGASVLITAREYASRTEERQSELAHELQWARWLTPDTQLTKNEIDKGLEILAQLIEESNA